MEANSLDDLQGAEGGYKSYIVGTSLVRHIMQC